MNKEVTDLCVRIFAARVAGDRDLAYTLQSQLEALARDAESTHCAKDRPKLTLVYSAD